MTAEETTAEAVLVEEFVVRDFGHPEPRVKAYEAGTEPQRVLLSAVRIYRVPDGTEYLAEIWWQRFEDSEPGELVQFYDEAPFVSYRGVDPKTDPGSSWGYSYYPHLLPWTIAKHHLQFGWTITS